MPTSKKRDNCKMGGNMRLSAIEMEASSSSLLYKAADQRLEERLREAVWWDIAGSSLSAVHGQGCPCHLWKCTSWSRFLLGLLLTCLINSDPFSCTYTSLLHTCVHIFHLYHSSLCRVDINRSLHLLVVQSWFVCLHLCVNPLLLSELSPTIGPTCGLSLLPPFFSSVSQQTTIFTSSHLQPPKNYNGTFWQA